MRVLLPFLLILLGRSISVDAADVTQRVRSTGIAVVQHGDLPAAFEQARRAALRQAVEEGVGVLITSMTRVQNFAIIDGAMNDLIRPALYSAWMGIDAVKPRSDVAVDTWDLVGPVCETGDFLGKDRKLRLQAGDLLAVRSAGAYGFVMSSNYNTRPRAAEVLVDGDTTHLVRRRETVSELLAGESLLPEA